MALDKSLGSVQGSLVRGRRLFGRRHDLSLVSFREANGTGRFRRLWLGGLKVFACAIFRQCTIHSASPFASILPGYEWKSHITSLYQYRTNASARAGRSAR